MPLRNTTQTTLPLDQLLGNAQDGIFVLDRQRGYVLINKAFERITGHPADQLIGRQCKCADTLHCQDDFGRSLSGVLCPAKGLFNGNRSTARQRMNIQRSDGSRVWIETVYTPILDPDGRVEYVLGIVRDASEAKEKEDEILNEMARLRDRVQQLSQEQKAHYGFDNIVSRSPLMTPVFEKVRAALHNTVAVLIHGESGAGKAFLARTIHTHSFQAEGPFVPINCAAFSPRLLESELFGYVDGAFPDAVRDYAGLLRSAGGGTVFIDDITAMPIATQAGFLRILQERRVRPVGGTVAFPVNIRVIAASNMPPRDAIARGLLREDLFYRLGVIQVALPPLRRRREDIPFLVQSFLDEFNRTHLRQIKEVSPDAWLTLREYNWPGNIRELAHVVESAFALGEGPVLEKSHLPTDIYNSKRSISPDTAKSLRLDPFLERVEREAIQRALQAAHWQRNKAASIMGISRSRLYRRMEALNIDPNQHD